MKKDTIQGTATYSILNEFRNKLELHDDVAIHSDLGTIQVPEDFIFGAQEKIADIFTRVDGLVAEFDSYQAS